MLESSISEVSGVFSGRCPAASEDMRAPMSKEVRRIGYISMLGKQPTNCIGEDLIFGSQTSKPARSLAANTMNKHKNSLPSLGYLQSLPFFFLVYFQQPVTSHHYNFCSVLATLGVLLCGASYDSLGPNNKRHCQVPQGVVVALEHRCPKIIVTTNIETHNFKN